MDGLASIIIPTHNRSESLKNSIFSVLKQSYQNIEIIIIANGCHDYTTTIVNEIKNSNHSKHIIYLKFVEALGGGKARNIGIAHASGEYIAFLDDDDSWHPDKLLEQIKLLNSNKYSIVGTDYIYVYDDWNKTHKTPGKTIKRVVRLEDMYYENCLGSFSFCTTKKAYLHNSRINEDLDALQDWDLWLKILIQSGKPAYIHKARHVYYRVGGKSISSNLQQVVKAQKIFINAWSHLLEAPSMDYHNMRTARLELKIKNQQQGEHCLGKFYRTCRTIFYSPYRYNIKRYIYYTLIPVVDIRVMGRQVKAYTNKAYSKIKNLARLLRDKLYIRKYHAYSLFKKSSGINLRSRETRLIISLTSYPQRFNSIYLTIESLLDQTVKPDHIILWLAKNEIEQTRLPLSIKKLRNRGLEIRIVDENIRSYKKLIHAIEQFNDYNIVTCDDDFIYPPWFLQELYRSYQQYPDCISAYRCRMMSKIDAYRLSPYQQWPFASDKCPSYNLFPTTGGGSLYPPGSLNEQVLDRMFLRLSPYADDIWFKAMSLLNKTKVVMVLEKSIDFPTVAIKNSQKTTLWKINATKNDEQLKNVFDHFELYNEITFI